VYFILYVKLFGYGVFTAAYSSRLLLGSERSAALLGRAQTAQRSGV